MQQSNEPGSEKDGEVLAEVFKALGDPTRLRLLKLLAGQKQMKDKCVLDLAQDLGISQPNVSHHLKILKTSGFIKCDKKENHSYYLVNFERLESLNSLLMLHIRKSEHREGEKP